MIYNIKEMGSEIMRTGLVLEGGGVRGIYTAGILDVFMENGITFDGVIGTSAGAIHAVSYLSGQKGRSIRYYKKYCTDYRFMSFKSFILTGDVVGVDFCYHELPEKLDIFDNEAFMRNNTPLYVVCSNVETGKPEYVKITDAFKEIDYIRASASLPYFSRIVNIGGKKLLDGGCTDSIAVGAFQRMGYDKNVVVLTRDIEYRKKPEMKWLAKAMYQKYPEFTKTLLVRHEMYNKQVEHIIELENKGELFVIRPDSPLDIGRMETNPQKIESVYNRGVLDAKSCITKLSEWLSE